MECLRKMEAKSNGSENRMPSIVEAGALAVATTVKDHSLTSKNNIESFHYDKKPRGVPKMPSPVNTNIQHNLNRTLVLMILFATSGFVIWNGEKWRPLYKKSAEEEEEKMLSYLFKNYYSTGLDIYTKEITASSMFAQYTQEISRFLENSSTEWSLKILSVDEFKSLLDTISKMRKSLKPHLRPYHFFEILFLMEQVYQSYVHEGICTGDLWKIIYEHMQEFSIDYPQFSNSKYYVEFKEKYNIFVKVVMIQNNVTVNVKQNDMNLSVLTLWEENIGVNQNILTDNIIKIETKSS